MDITQLSEESKTDIRWLGNYSKLEQNHGFIQWL